MQFRRAQSLVRQFSSVSLPHSKFLCSPNRANRFSNISSSYSIPVTKTLSRTFCDTSGSISNGDKVSVHYTGTLDQGEEFDSSYKRNTPLSFKVGKGQMIPGFETNVRGMKKGEKKTFTLPPAEAYGEIDSRAIISLPLDQLPPGVEVGQRLQAQAGQTALVVSIDEKEAKLDCNHQLAGKSLTFDIEIVDIASKGDGIKIDTIQAGDGKTFPSAGDTLTMHYTGTLASTGSQFDCSRTRNQPFKFTIGVGQVIEGWDEGVMALSLGQRAKLSIPSDMGYGERGAGADIPPNADLVFDVELLKIDPRA